MAALEDLGFYCVDNLPAQLTIQFLDLCTKANPPIEKIALAVDCREETFSRLIPSVVSELREQGVRVEVLFLDCADETVARRYRETRRVHPMSPSGSVEEGIARERRQLVDLASIADVEIETTSMNVHELKKAIGQQVVGTKPKAIVNLISFGFRYGTPDSVESLFDLRCLPNPYFEEELRDGSGLDAEVADYVLKSEAGSAFLERIVDFLAFVLPLYDQEGKAYLTVGLGCTGGRHRSVALVAAVAARLRERGREVNVEHRDVESKA
ncbi:MAG: RNase adapter RapZ [Deltaproteobacteria bacterium]|nr:RNase adapter RapZ [Deltaproteobacteria bacterium]MBW2417663.1 RNase adapter RapZ [Deltaproteobacteria bacterium]